MPPRPYFRHFGTPIQRFLQKVKWPTECLEWGGSTDGKGYGNFYINQNKGNLKSPRFMMALVYGTFNKGLHVLHHCDNPPCINPTHLFLGTPQDNSRDASCKGRLMRGIDQHNGKLSPVQVRLIRRAYNGKRGFYTKTAKQYFEPSSKVAVGSG